MSITTVKHVVLFINIPLLEKVVVLQTLDFFFKKNKVMLYCMSLVIVHSPDWLSKPLRSKTVNCTSPRVCLTLHIQSKLCAIIQMRAIDQTFFNV